MELVENKPNTFLIVCFIILCGNTHLKPALQESYLPLVHFNVVFLPNVIEWFLQSSNKNQGGKFLQKFNRSYNRRKSYFTSFWHYFVHFVWWKSAKQKSEIPLSNDRINRRIDEISGNKLELFTLRKSFWWGSCFVLLFLKYILALYSVLI